HMLCLVASFYCLSCCVFIFFICFVVLFFFFFFFQAEDGIRDGHVTGVQTCALPISTGSRYRRYPGRVWPSSVAGPCWALACLMRAFGSAAPCVPGSERCARSRRSEERRVGKEGRARRGAGAYREKAR